MARHRETTAGRTKGPCSASAEMCSTGRADTRPVRNCKWMTVPSALVQPTHLPLRFGCLLLLTTFHVPVSPLPSTHKLTV